MTKLLRLVIAMTFAITLQQTAVSQSLSINTTGATADASAILDVTSTLKGMLIPRMNKTQKNAIATPANGLLVYQTGPDSIGFHYYNLPGTQWVYINTNGFATDTTAWKLTGNNNVVDTSFLGSINNKAVKFRVNNLPSGIIDSSTGDAALGYRALTTGHSSPGFYANNAFGFEAGRSLNSGFANIAIGRHALASTGVSTQNIAIGDSAMAQAVSAHTNMAIGYQALKNYNGGGYLTYNTAIGYSSQSAASSTVGGANSYFNTSIGGFAMADNRGGFANVAVGVSALRFNDSSAANTAIGFNAMAYHKRSGFNSNVAVGSYALESDSIGFWNTVVGAEAMQNAKNGGVNVAVGFRSMRAHKVGGENTAVGVGSLEADSSGTQNTAVGRSAMFFNKAAARNTVVGAEAAAFNNYLQTNPLQGSENTYVGFNSGRTANIGRKNAVLGAYALEGSGIYGDQPTLDAYSRNSVVGDSAALRTFGNDNVAMGFKALNANTGGSQHVAVGSRALAKATAGYPNTAVGYSSMDSTSTGFANTAVGSFSLTDNKTGFNNVAVGNAAMFQSTAGSNNTVVGNDAGRFIRNNQNTAIGSAALRNDSTGVDNVAMGYRSSFSNDTASRNTSIGRDALFYNKTNDMVAVGYRAGLYSGFTGPTYFSRQHTSVGTEAGLSNFEGDKITAVGYRAYYNFNGGTYTANNVGRNTAIGDSAMALTYGAYNVAVGTEALSVARSSSRNVAIGDSSMGNALNTSDNVGVGYKTLSQVRNQGNTAMGTYAGQKLANTVWNTAIGYHALESDTTGSENTVVGTSAFRQNANGIRNASLGINTGFWIKGSNNTFLGSYAGEGSSTGSTTATSNTAVGFVALRNIRSGNQNTALGEYALSSDTSGSLNVAVGAGSLESLLRGDNNVAMGFWAGRQDTASERNVYIGRDAGYSNQRDDVVAIGYRALYNNTVGAIAGQSDNNVAVGSRALEGNTTGGQNTAIGISALNANTSGIFNTAVGANTLMAGNGNGNTAIGSNSMAFITSGGYNAAVGANTLYNNQTGFYNMAMGHRSLFANTSGNYNIAVGINSLTNNISSSYNIAIGDSALGRTIAAGTAGNLAIGHDAGKINTTGTFNNLIGYGADVLSIGLTNATAIGKQAAVNQSNSMVLGSINGVNSATATTSVGIGTTTPGARLHIRRNGASGGTFIANASLLIEDNANSFIQLSNPNSSENGILSTNAGAGIIRSGIVFGNDSTIFLRAGGNVNRMIIDNNGYIGVGSTASYPLTQFHLNEPLPADVNFRISSVSAQVPGIELTKGSGNADWKIFNSTGNLLTLARATDDFITVPQNYYEWGITAYRPTIDNNNSLGLVGNRWTTVYAFNGVINTSDARDKENINDLNYGLSEIMKLRPVSYNWKENPQWGKKIGFIAQEVKSVLNEVVQQGELKSKVDAKNDLGNDLTPNGDKLGIYYSDIIPVTVKAIQEQQLLIIKQQKTIEELIKRIEKLEKKD